MKSKKNILVFILFIVGYFLILYVDTGELSLVPNSITMLKISQDEIDGNMKNITRKENIYTTTTNNSSVSFYNLKDRIGKVYAIDIKVNSKKDLGDSQVYYFENNEVTTAENVISFKMQLGENVIKLPKNKEITGLRLDFSNKAGSQINIEGIYINDGINLVNNFIVELIILILVLAILFYAKGIMLMLSKQMDKFRITKKNKFIKFIIFIFLIKGIFYAVYLIPPTLVDAPDEVGHFSYVAYMAYEHKTPKLNKTQLEHSSRKMGYDAGQTSDFNYMSYNITHNFDWGTNNIAQHPPLYYLLCAPAFLLINLFTTKLVYLIYAVRIFTLIFGAIFILYSYKVLKKLEINENLIKIVTFLLVFNPIISYYLAIINNDSLLTVLSAMSLYYLISYIKESKIKDYFIFVICATLMMFTKYTAVIVLIPYTIFLAVEMVLKMGILKSLKKLILGGLIAMAILVPWFVRNFLVYSGKIMPVANSIPNKNNFTLFDYIDKLHYFDVLYGRVYYWMGAFRRSLMSSDFEKKIFALFILIAAISLVLIEVYRKKWRELLITFVIFIFSYVFVRKHVFGDYIFIFYISFLLISIITMQIKAKDEFVKKFQIISISTIYFSIFIMLIQQYQSFKYSSLMGGIQGRYYLLVALAFFYLILNAFDEVFRKSKMYIKVVYVFLAISMLSEIHTILRYLRLWNKL